MKKLTLNKRRDFALAYVLCAGDPIAAAKSVGICEDKAFLRALPYDEAVSKEIDKCLQQQISRELALAALDACKTLHRILCNESSEAKEASTAAKEILSRFNPVKNGDVLQSDSEVKLIFGEEYI